jgi:endonuclease I
LDLDWVPQYSGSRIDYMIKIKNVPNLNKESFEEIFASGHFDKISSCWSKDGRKECSKQCGTFDKLNAQYEKKAYA